MTEKKIKKQEKEPEQEEILLEQDIPDEIKNANESFEPGEKVEPKKHSAAIEDWNPKTEIGKKVKAREITDIDEILDNGLQILEPEITDILLPNLETDLLLIGQSKGKFGGGQRRVFKQTQKKTREGNKPHFATIAVAGNSNGYIGIGIGKSKETVPAREKAIRRAKLSVFKIRRGCGSWQCTCSNPHSIPFAVQGKVGSVTVKLLPAPRGKGIIAPPELRKILKLVGIEDVWSQTSGMTTSRINIINATINALKSLVSTKVSSGKISANNIIEGRVQKEESPEIMTAEEINKEDSVKEEKPKKTEKKKGHAKK